MKKEVAFFRDKRASSAETFIALCRSLGMTDEQIKQEMLKIEQKQAEQKQETR